MTDAREAFFKKAFSEIYTDSELKFFFKGLNYSFFSGGKRFRPKLLEAVAGALDISARKSQPAALAIELVHTYSLVHDDLPSMDDDTYRRGRLSHHVKYGEASAVLAGDSFLTSAFEVLALHYKGEVLRRLVLALSQASGVQGMVGGQVLDCLTGYRSEDIFYKIHLLKTAKLFGFCFEAPALIAELDAKKAVTFKSLGENLGLLFQLQDDMLDKEKKDEREEENILSILSEAELIQKIEKQKELVSKELLESGLSENKEVQNLCCKVFERKK